MLPPLGNAEHPPQLSEVEKGVPLFCCHGERSAAIQSGLLRLWLAMTWSLASYDMSQVSIESGLSGDYWHL
jgi:hypothetical protein